MRQWKKGLSAVFVVFMLCLAATSASAYDSADRATEAYNKIDAAVAEEFGRNESTQLANYPAGFGGAWLDEENYLVIGLAPEGRDDREYYTGLSGDGEVLRFVDVKYSLQQLLDIQAEIAQSYPTMDQVDFYLEGALINLETNTVELTVMQGGLDSAMALFTELYGDAVSGVEGQEAIEGTISGETTEGLVIHVWLLVAIIAVVLASIALAIILIVLLIQHIRKKNKLKKEEMEKAAARAAQAVKSKKK